MPLSSAANWVAAFKPSTGTPGAVRCVLPITFDALREKQTSVSPEQHVPGSGFTWCQRCVFHVCAGSNYADEIVVSEAIVGVKWTIASLERDVLVSRWTQRGS